jgi:hypothetical protein
MQEPPISGLSNYALLFISDLEETFNSLRKFQWKIHKTKFVFSVPQGKLLGFIVSHHRIEVNPEKITTTKDMGAPWMIKDVQKLRSCMTALNKFLSRLGERGIPFFKLLKHHIKFQWTEKAKQALQDLSIICSRPYLNGSTTR